MQRKETTYRALSILQKPGSRLSSLSYYCHLDVIALQGWSLGACVYAHFVVMSVPLLVILDGQEIPLKERAPVGRKSKT